MTHCCQAFVVQHMSFVYFVQNDTSLVPLPAQYTRPHTHIHKQIHRNTRVYIRTCFPAALIDAQKPSPHPCIIRPPPPPGHMIHELSNKSSNKHRANIMSPNQGHSNTRSTTSPPPTLLKPHIMAVSTRRLLPTQERYSFPSSHSTAGREHHTPRLTGSPRPC